MKKILTLKGCSVNPVGTFLIERFECMTITDYVTEYYSSPCVHICLRGPARAHR